MNNKSKILIFIFMIFGFVPKVVWGQTDWHVSSPESVAISLNGLKQSSKQMTERNQWLISEIKILEMKIEVQKKLMARQSGSRESEISLRAKEGGPAKAERAIEPYLKDRIVARSQKEERLLKEIAVVTEELQQMNLLINQQTQSSFHGNETEVLDAKLGVLQTQVNELQIRNQAFDKEHSKSLGKYESLKEKNNLLKQKLSLLDGYYQNAEAEEKNILDELKGFESRNSKLLDEIQTEISELRTEGNSLDKVLRQAGNKIKEKDTAFDISEEEIELLMENLSFIEKENRALKEKLNRVQEDSRKQAQSAQSH